MQNKIKNIAIITVRSGSYRIKNKSTKIFFGRPIIFYTIRILKKTNIFDRIYLSTNCSKTIKAAKKYGINNIIYRKKYYDKNDVGTISVINFCLKELKKNGINPKFVCCHYPAAPLSDYNQLIFAHKILKKEKINFLFPVINLMKSKVEKKKIIKISSIQKKKGILNKTYLDAGQFWYAKSNTWKKSKTVYDRNSFFLPTNLKYSDINTLKDWKNVKKIFLKSKKI